ncbi:MAG: carboxypeptidase-like regulatory domain-containing protein, partial [Limisphaerales bacterium]
MLLLTFLIALGGLVPLYAQSSTGSISGTVADQNEAVIPNATVLIKNTGTGFSRFTTATSDGRYHFVSVPTGTYELTVEAATFSKYIREGITLDVNQNA